MGRRGANNPRQKRSKLCGCRPCLEEYPDPPRKKRRDCVGSWQARYRDADGVQRSKNFDTKRDADAFLDEVRSSVRRGTYLDPRRGDITLTAWWGQWWPSHKTGRPTTVSRKLGLWRAHIEPKWGRRSIASLTYMELQDWIATGVKGRATQVKTLALLRAMLQAAVRDQRIPFNPAADVQPTAAAPAKHPDDLAPPTPDQYALVRAQLPVHAHPLVDFAQETGMRWGEYTALRWSAVDLENATVTVREVLVEVHGHLQRQGVPKTTAGFRTVPLTPRAVDAVKVMADLWPKHDDRRSQPSDGMLPEELVFRSVEGAPLRRNNFRRHWIDAIKNAGIAREVTNSETGRSEWWPRVHDYRHALASRLHEAGVSERDVQTVLGQERGGRVTWLYTHGSVEAIETVRAAMQAGGRHLRAVS
ncbi:MAG TPA: site-specific integrase [Streptomyces sp.]|nr:site-specific integrase [Streptomyces sp.]